MILEKEVKNDEPLGFEGLTIGCLSRDNVTDSRKAERVWRQRVGEGEGNFFLLKFTRQG